MFTSGIQTQEVQWTEDIREVVFYNAKGQVVDKKMIDARQYPVGVTFTPGRITQSDQPMLDLYPVNFTKDV